MDTDRLNSDLAVTRNLTKPVPPKMEIISDPPWGKLEFAFGVGCTSATYWLIVYAIAQALGVFSWTLTD